MSAEATSTVQLENPLSRFQAVIRFYRWKQRMATMILPILITWLAFGAWSVNSVFGVACSTVAGVLQLMLFSVAWEDFYKLKQLEYCVELYRWALLPPYTVFNTAQRLVRLSHFLLSFAEEPEQNHVEIWCLIYQIEALVMTNDIDAVKAKMATLVGKLEQVQAART